MKFAFGILFAFGLFLTALLVYDWTEQRVVIELLRLKLSDIRNDFQQLEQEKQEQELLFRQEVVKYQQGIQHEKAARLADKESFLQEIQKEKMISFQQGKEEATAAATLKTKRLILELGKEKDSLHQNEMEALRIQYTNRLLALENELMTYKEQYTLLKTQLEEAQSKKSWWTNWTSNNKKTSQKKHPTFKSGIPSDHPAIVLSLLFAVCVLSSGAVARLRFNKRRR